MLRNTFRHIKGIGENTEKKLWFNGIDCWDKARVGTCGFKGSRLESFHSQLKRSQEELDGNNARFFADLLPASAHWRIFPEFKSHVGYLDIETTGLYSRADYVTTIVLYDGHRVRHYVQGQNLDRFEDDMGDFRLIVTYNGKCFDLPFIEKSLGVKIPYAHIDLRYILKHLGYAGGLKKCERTMGFSRPGLEDVDGFFAVLLWDDYLRSRNERVLETLLAYNAEDVLSLERLLHIAYNTNIASTPFAGSHMLDPVETVPNPFEAHADVIERIRGSANWPV